MMTLRRRPEIPTRILVTVLTMSERSGWVNPELVNFLANMADDSRFAPCYVPTHNFAPYDVARQAAVNSLLASQAGYLLMIDNDTVPAFFGKPVNLLELALARKAIIGAPCPIYTDGRLIYNLYADDGAGKFKTLGREQLALTGYGECDGIGAGALMIRRDVCERIQKLGRQPFLYERGADGSGQLGEDFYFCRLARQLCYKIHYSLKHVCGHAKTIDLNHMVLTRQDFAEVVDLQKTSTI